MRASIIIRTLNEAKHLGDLLQAISQQQTDGMDWEVVIVDSGSTDGTLEIARAYDCRIEPITREEFSFGRSLNLGCEAATGDFLVLISGHCVPCDERWLQVLCQPLIDSHAEYSYGRQLGGTDSHYSECQIFAKYFPEKSRVPQSGFYCNNANSALTRLAWEEFGFDEQLTGLEDMELAQRLTKRGGRLAYVAEAPVYHYHSEEWRIIERRFEREAIALQHIMPHVHIRKYDLLRYVVSSVWMDWRSAWKEQVFGRKAVEILFYRGRQYWGSYKGNRDHRKLSHSDKEVYFFPSKTPSLSPPKTVLKPTIDKPLRTEAKL